MARRLLDSDLLTVEFRFHDPKNECGERDHQTDDR